MSRPVRIEFPGAYYHITSRGYVTSKGANNDPVFHDEEDRKIFLTALEAVVVRFGWLVHAYVLMDSHYHLILECPEANLSKGMRQLNGVYTQYFNRRHKLEGPLFQGRFKSILFEAKKYLLPLCRYIVLNPVRLKTSTSAQIYRWSSHRATGGLVSMPLFLHVDTILSSFGESQKENQRRYREYVKEGIGERSPLLNKSAQVLLGSAQFISEMHPILNGEKLAKRGPKRARRRRSLPAIFKNVEHKTRGERNDLICRAHIDHAYTLMEIGGYLGLHYTTVSKVVNQA